MKNNTRNVARSLTAGVAGALLAGSLTAPAEAAIIKIPVKPKPPVPKIEVIQFPSDLQVASLEATQLTGGVLSGAWRIKATLKNTVKAFPGGGKLVIRRTTGGMIPVEPPYLFGPSVEDQGTILAEKPIPAMAVGQTLTLETISTKRAIFVAQVVSPIGDPDDNQLEFPEGPKTNNSQSVNKLVPKQFWLDTGFVQTQLDALTSQIKLRLDKTDSYAKLGTYYESHWKTADVNSPLSGAADLAVRDINAESTLEIAGTNMLVLLMKFDTAGVELDSPLVKLNASPVEVAVRMPLSYNAASQFVYCADQPQIDVSAKIVGLPAQWGSVQVDFDNRIANAVRDVFSHEKVQQRLEFELNRQIREKMLKNNGRITNVDMLGWMKIHAEVGE
jgi:hypothetical protein